MRHELLSIENEEGDEAIRCLLKSTMRVGHRNGSYESCVVPHDCEIFDRGRLGPPSRRVLKYIRKKIAGSK